MESRRPSDNVKNMCATWAILVVAMVAEGYSPDLHLQTVAKRLEEIKVKIAASEDGAATKATVGRLLGQYIGEDRKDQAALSAFLRSAKGDQAVVALKVVRVSGLWQAYLSSAVLALDGDTESRDLRDMIDRRLTRLLPSRPSVGKSNGVPSRTGAG
jgi:hypothetical protein